ncbi:MAG: phosphate-starvation-inducible protein PsiE [Thiotrichales bacterium]
MNDASKLKELPRIVLHAVESVGLLVIMIATVIAAGSEVARMISSASVHLADLLLLFIYLEVLAMVGVYYKSHSLPVRMPLYISIVALARHMILDMKEMTDMQMLTTAVGMLIIAGTVLLVRFGHVKFPYGDDDKPSDSAKS